jgi:hypothetical protein
MIGTAPRKLNHAMKSLPAMLTALVLGGAALPALAQGDAVPGLQFRAPEPVAPVTARRSDLFVEHKVRLGMPPALTGEQSADAPKFSVELGYGKASPPLLGSAGLATLPEEFWGRTDQRAVKANLNFGF